MEGKSMIEFEQGMFDRVKFDFREAGPGKVAAERVKRYRNAHSNAVVAENESPLLSSNLLSSNSLSDSDSSSPSTENVFR